MEMVWYSLYDRILTEQGLYEAYLKVKSAKGAAGIDGHSIKDFGKELRAKLTVLARELREKTYRPQPVRRVEIPKPDWSQEIRSACSPGPGSTTGFTEHPSTDIRSWVSSIELWI